jgi:alkanesulfonate monooxygenase SsuD/methylene tetrahydromethanopterin reductase-like flavin-dependent oxidoreductase (luciferase family)
MNSIPYTPSLGVIFHPRFPSADLAGYARRAEAAGFDELWLWDDCFLPGAFTSAAVALSATQRLKVGIGLIPAPAYNPLFAAMEITTLACAFPGRFLPGFGYGVGSWMAQIGAAPKPSLSGLKETVTAVRGLLRGERVTVQGERVHLEQVQMQVTPEVVPPVYVGAIREKSLRMAGQAADGVILTGMSSPEYIRKAIETVRAGSEEAGRTRPRVAVYLDTKVGKDGGQARAAAKRALVARLPWDAAQMEGAGLADEVTSFVQTFTDPEEAMRHFPEAWVDAFAAAGTPEQTRASIRRWFAAGADTVILQPLNGDPDCLEEYAQFLGSMADLKLA